MLRKEHQILPRGLSVTRVPLRCGQLNYLDCCKFVTTQTALRSAVASSRDVELASHQKIIHRVQIDRLGLGC
jgi:hypothetical protein